MDHISPISTLSWHWGLPFGGLLLAIALVPLVSATWWHRHYPKAVMGAIAVTVIPLWLSLKVGVLHEFAHAILKDYLPFLCAAGSLYIISSGIRVRFPGQGRPYSNMAVLAIGAVLASWIGTTGASMLLIRPLLAANSWRRYRAHTVVFFIFLVSNVGGMLSPLGDPPLFLGFLNGVSFFWPLQHLWPAFIQVLVPLIVVYYMIDTSLYHREKDARPEAHVPWHITGEHNIIWLVAVIGVVLGSSFLPMTTAWNVFGVEISWSQLVRDMSLILIAKISYRSTSDYQREQNHFSWAPLQEVAIIFMGLFVTLVPIQMMLQAGMAGPFAPVFSILNRPNPELFYFGLTGVLSAFLDNAPTYMVFFKMAGGHAPELMTFKSSILVSISLGAVLMGAMTYIGNAPNLMVKSIAEEEGVHMPSFFGYIGWACLLLPLYFWGFYNCL